MNISFFHLLSPRHEVTRSAGLGLSADKEHADLSAGEDAVACKDNAWKRTVGVCPPGAPGAAVVVGVTGRWHPETDEFTPTDDFIQVYKGHD